MKSPRTPRGPKTPPDQRTGWETMQSAIRWRYTEPEYKAVIAALLSNLDIQETIGLVYQSAHEDAETGLLRILGGAA